MSEKRFYELTSSIDYYQIWDKQEDKGYTVEDAVDKLNSLVEEKEQLKEEHKVAIDEMITDYKELENENEQLKNELRKEKSLREYSDSMYDKDLIVNIRFSKGEWKADVSVIDNE